jgi:hypothetical protein
LGLLTVPPATSTLEALLLLEEEEEEQDVLFTVFIPILIRVPVGREEF